MRIRRSLITMLTAAAVAFSAMAGCGPASSDGAAPAAETSAEADSPAAENETAGEGVLADGVYTAYFTTGSTMFYVNEADHGTGVLTVEDGQMTIHIRLVSESIVNLYPGTKAEAQAEGAVLLEPTVETVTYDDGMTSDVNAYDVPVPYLDESFPVSIIGTHGNWYEHQVTVSLVGETGEGPAGENAGDNTTETPEAAPAGNTAGNAEPVPVSEMADGTYDAEVSLSGGSGRASVMSPTTLTVTGGTAIAVVEWDSANYDYMVVNGETYYPVNNGGNSVFEIPIDVIGAPIDVIGDTTAMSQPHEIDYTLTFTIG